MLIFNFHHVDDATRHPSRKHITITPKGLQRFIRTLRFWGFEFVSLKDVLHDGGLKREHHQKQAIITFDDGYVNNYEEAAPVLEAEKCPATIFVLPGRFEGTNAWDQGHLPEPDRDQLMTLEQMQTLAKSPYITFGSHGMTHRDFSKLNNEDLQLEMYESHRILSETLGDAYLPVLAYPWGNYSQNVLAQMEESPYEAAFTVETAPWQQDSYRFEIPRYSAFFRDGNPVVLSAKLLRHGVLFN